MPNLIHLEDDGPLREVFKIALESYDQNMKCTQFSNSDNLMDYVDNLPVATPDDLETPKVFVLDIRVPGQFNGMEVAEELRKRGILTPIIVTSAYQKPDTKTLGALDLMWMPKPWHILDAAKKIVPLAYKD